MRLLARPLGTARGSDALNVWEHILFAEYIDNFWNPERDLEDREIEAALDWHQECYANAEDEEEDLLESGFTDQESEDD